MTLWCLELTHTNLKGYDRNTIKVGDDQREVISKGQSPRGEYANMQHEFRLYARPYESIQAGRKRYEIRLHDDKRQQIVVGDTIAFTRVPDGAGPLLVEVIGLRKYRTFEELYLDIPMIEIDCAGWTMDELLSSTYSIYSREQELKYGAVAIEIRLVPQ